MKIKNISNEKRIEYRFHRTGCSAEGMEPCNHPDKFRLRGNSPAGGKKYQCKECNKITTLKAKPLKAKSSPGNFGYERSCDKGIDKMVKLIMSRKTVTQICSALDVSPVTYYHKLQELAVFLRNKRKEKENIHFSIRTTAPIYINVDIRPCSEEDGCRNVIVSCDFLTGYIYAASPWVNSKEKLEKAFQEHMELTMADKHPEKWIFIASSDRAKKMLSNEMPKDASVIGYGKNKKIDEFLNYLDLRINRTDSKHAEFYTEIGLYCYNFSYPICKQEGGVATPAKLMGI
jgi:hypothetical protein